MIRRPLPLFAAALAGSLLCATAAAAHGDRDHAAPKPAKKAAPAQAAEPAEHTHAAPHAGQLVDIDKDLHAEVVFGPAGIAVFFYDADMKPLPPPTEGKLTLVVGKGTKKVPLALAPLPAPQDHLFAAEIVPAGTKVVAMMQATVAGKPRTARVERPATAAPAVTAPAPPTTAAPQ